MATLEMADRDWLAETGALDHRLYSILGGMSQNHWEYSIAHALLSRFMRPPRYILEIGVYSGHSMMGWLELAKPGQPDIAVGVDMAPTVTAPLPPFVRIIEGDSHDADVVSHVVSLFPRGVDFLFIDGDHSLRGCLMDFNCYAPLVNPGGVVGFHDILNGDVRATWREVVRRYPTVQIQDKAPDGSQFGMGFAFQLPYCKPFKTIAVDD